MYTWNDGSYLMHHGILGQKWGKRNGPPYPLDAKSHSKSEKDAGWRKSLNKSKSKQSKSIKDKWNDLDPKTKKTVKIGAAVAITSLAAYGLYRTGALNPLIKKGREAISSSLNNKTYTGRMMYDYQKDEFYSKDLVEKSIDGIKAAVSGCNPSGSMTNCVATSAVNELRRRGRNVVALERGASPFKISELKKLFIGFDPIPVNYKGINKESAERHLRDEILKYGEGTRGILLYDINSTPIQQVISRFAPFIKTRTSGHAMSWEILGGQVVYSDGQYGTIIQDLVRDRLNKVDLGSFQIGMLSELELNESEIKRFSREV